MRHFLRVLGVARRHAAWVGVALASMVVVAGATVFIYNLVRPLYDQVLTPSTSPAVAVVAVPRPTLIEGLDGVAREAQEGLTGVAGGREAALLLLVLVAVVVKNGFTLLSRFAVARLGLATIRDLRDRVFDALLGQSARYFHDTSSGVLISRVVNDVQLINEALSERFGDLLQDVLTVVVVLAYVLSLNFRLAMATLVLAPLLLAPVLVLSRRLRRRSRQSQERMGELTSILDEAVKGIRIIQAFCMETFAARRFRRATRRHFRANLRARTIQAANAPVMEIVGVVAALALIAYAASQIAADRMTLGDFSAFLVGVYGTYNPIKRLNKFNLALQQASVAAERVFAVIDAPAAVREAEHPRELKGIGAGVELDRVSFAYEDGRTVLRDLDLRIPTGHTVALVGPSGAGKSTIAQLIPRFWDVDDGAVRVGGEDVRELRLGSLRECIGLVTQETVLFNDTVRANIMFGRDEASAEAVEAAARAALAHNFVIDLPQAYDTVIGEAGMKLSAGQRQRLAIARALFKDPELLILDEATSALDPEAEVLVRRALENLMRGRTTLVIAHRLGTVRGADSIAVVGGGRIVEQGDHDRLMSLNGAYRRMVEMQEFQ